MENEHGAKEKNMKTGRPKKRNSIQKDWEDLIKRCVEEGLDTAVHGLVNLRREVWPDGTPPHETIRQIAEREGIA